MNVALFAYSRQGLDTAERVAVRFAGDTLRRFTVARLARGAFAPIPTPSRAFYGELFSWADALVFVGACGIAVRAIAPHVRSKQTDPAVVSIDVLAKFVVPLLSGHIGGANDLAVALAENLGATAVVTTATDSNHRFSVDAWATRQGYALSSMEIAKSVSAAILEGDVAFCSDFPVVSPYAPGLVPEETGDLGIYLGCYEKSPFAHTLRIIPPVLHLGIGCRRGTSKETIAAVVEAVLRQNGLDRRAVRCVASIDLKADEDGLRAYCEGTHWPLSFYSAEQLRAIPGDFTASAFVCSVTGVDNVCERAALWGAARLLVRKNAKDGVTVAAAVEDLEIRF